MVRLPTSLRARLLLITLLATSIPALLLVSRNLDDREQAMQRYTAQLQWAATQAAEVLADRVRGTAQLHYGLARSRDLESGDRATCSAFLSTVLQAHPQYTAIATIRPDGQVHCDSLRSRRELDTADRAIFRRALDSPDQIVLEPATDRVGGVAVLQVAYPVRGNHGELRQVLLASLDLRDLAEPQPFPVPGGRLLLASSSGAVLAASGVAGDGPGAGASIAGTPLFSHAATATEAQAARIVDEQGRPQLWAVARPPLAQDAQILVLAGAPEAALLEQANHAFVRDVAVVAALTLGLFLMVWLLAELTVRRQVSRLTDMAGRLAVGDLSARIEEPLPHGELGALMNVMNQTAQSLEEQRDDIARLNERLRQSQRLEAVGQLTGGVAHDFNNLLTVVIGNAELLTTQAEPGSAQRALAEMIDGAARRGAELTRQLLAFAGRQALDPRPIDLNELVDGMDAMLRRALGEHIEVEIVRGEPLWPAMVDPTQLEGALLNLCLNGRDAMPDGGRLTLETANVVLDRAYCARRPDVLPGPYVMLCVSDGGCGIPRENLEKVFEPFFTTKAKGRGTGLGLAMVYGYVKQSGGHVSIYSEVDHGTTVKLYLPRAARAETSQSTAFEPAPEAVGGEETVLVVEDDDFVRHYVSGELRSLGYRVVDAPDGHAALAWLRQRRDVDLLFTDVVMPGGLSGRALADQARALQPGLRVLYTSGYTENAIVHHGRLDPGVSLLSKPYRRADLARAVRGVMAAQP